MSSEPGRARAGERPVAIEVRDVAKAFRIPLERADTLKERAVRPRHWLGTEHRELVALRGVSFDVHRGEFFGVVGRNGSGKSTLLKLLASIYQLDAGSIRVAGRLAPFIELGVGFNPELSAEENVALNGVMMGLTPRQARGRFDAVIEFAELEEFTELKLKNYSSGMHVRLAFSLMLQVDADVLLIDEVLAVGDAAFQRRCIEALERMRDQGRTIVLVSHDMNSIQRHCDRAMLIEDGRIDVIGSPLEVASRYVEVSYTRPGRLGEPVGARGGPAGAAVKAVWVSDEEGHPVTVLERDEPLTLNARLRASEALADVRLYLELLGENGVRVAAFPVGDDGEIGDLAPGEEVEVSVRVENRLALGDYSVHQALVAQEPALRILDQGADACKFTVTGEGVAAALVHLEHEVQVRRVSTGALR